MNIHLETLPFYVFACMMIGMFVVVRKLINFIKYLDASTDQMNKCNCEIDARSDGMIGEPERMITAF